MAESDWNALEQSINCIYEGFSDELSKRCNLSVQELRVCLLIKVGICPTEIGKFVARSKECITAIRRRLYEKAFHKKGTPKQWDEFIRSLRVF